MSECYNKALQILSRREYSQVELKKKLLFKDFDEDEILSIIDILKKQKYQSDKRFGESLINTRVNQGKGSIIIKNELSLHNINEVDLTEINFFELCKKVKTKKFGIQKYQDNKEKAKQIMFLKSRGFSFDEINFSIEMIK